MSKLPTTPFVLLEDSKSRNRPDAGLLFEHPKKILTCSNIGDVPSALNEIQEWPAKGFFLAGWFSYECGLAFHPQLKKKTIKQSNEPLVWMGVFEKPRQLSSLDLDQLFANTRRQTPRGGFHNKPVLAENFSTFEAALKKIQNYISAGDVYQVNYTFRMLLQAFGDVHSLYADLRQAQPVPFGALIDTADWSVLSLSPELFITRTGDTLLSSPMKGTAPIGIDMPETACATKMLSRDKKNRAENLMITDLVRNDFSRVCKPGSVQVENMFAVERFSQVLQMTSDVKGCLQPGVSFPEIFSSLFPCGSVTGAPKIRAMEIIDETEVSPRGVYTGALGYLAPTADFVFSVPIRTIVLDKAGTGWMGVGSGVIADSKIQEEHGECMLKGNFLFADEKDFALIETMLWEPGTGYAHLQAHLTRLRASAEYFDFAFQEKEITQALQHFTATFETGRQKVRLLCQADGEFTLECFPAKPGLKGTKKIKLSSRTVCSHDRFLYHKTTIRNLYDQEKRIAGADYYDVIFRNEKGEITEGTFNNIFIETGEGRLLTPAKKSGLLPGVFRDSLLQLGAANEASLNCDDLKKANKIFLGNSISDLVEVKLIS